MVFSGLLKMEFLKNPVPDAMEGLSLLIHIHTARFHHYDDLFIKEHDKPLRMLYRKYAAHSYSFVKAVGPWLAGQGGPAYEQIKVKESNRIWKAFQSFFSAEETSAFLHRSEVVERYTLWIHRKALALTIIPSGISQIIQHQLRHCERAFDMVKLLQDKSFNFLLVTR